jgi:hypothetical protein
MIYGVYQPIILVGRIGIIGNVTANSSRHCRYLNSHAVPSRSRVNIKRLPDSCIRQVYGEDLSFTMGDFWYIRLKCPGVRGRDDKYKQWLKNKTKTGELQIPNGVLCSL